jgi:hypothetical protein
MMMIIIIIIIITVIANNHTGALQTDFALSTYIKHKIFIKTAQLRVCTQETRFVTAI